jgi:hypothetical protein
MPRLPLLLSLLLSLAGLVLTACSSQPNRGQTPAASGGELAARIDTSDWMVKQGSAIWRVLEDRTVNGETRPPRHIGYVHAKDYRQGRGGPVQRLYEVTSLNRSEVLGQIDSLGRVTRFEPQRNSTFQERPLTPAGRMEDNVGAIFGSSQQITLELTSERRIAFATFDRDGNGVLAGAELEHTGTRILSADADGDKQVDFTEFDTLDSF